MAPKPHESHAEWHQRVRNDAASLYTEVLPLSKTDRDYCCVSIQVGDDPSNVARFTIEVMEGATCRNPSACFAVDQRLMQLNTKAKGK